MLVRIQSFGFAVYQELFFTLIGRLRLGHQITLKTIASQLLEYCSLTFCLDPFGHDFHVQGFCQCHNTGNNGAVAEVYFNVLNKRAVDF